MVSLGNECAVNGIVKNAEGADDSYDLFGSKQLVVGTALKRVEASN
jgi:hypothetical protein